MGTPMRLGIDLDGVLANWDQAFHGLLQEVTGRELPEPIPAVWNWPRVECGCSTVEINAAWRRIRARPEFWYELNALDLLDLAALGSLEAAHSLYFITSRVPELAKQQTEWWLHERGLVFPTVLLSNDKGWIAKGLSLDIMLDDKPENLDEVRLLSPKTRCYLKDRPFNAGANYPRVSSVCEMLEKEGLR